MAKLITPALGTIILSVIALIAVWTQQPLLAPSLGSAAFTQLLSPQTAGARPYSIFMGQLVGVLAGSQESMSVSPRALPCSWVIIYSSIRASLQSLSLQLFVAAYNSR